MYRRGEVWETECLELQETGCIEAWKHGGLDVLHHM